MTKAEAAKTDPLLHLPGSGRARVLVDGLDHPEGVCWDPVARVVYAGGEAGQVYRVSLEEARSTTMAMAPDFVLGLAADGNGRLVLCVAGDHPSICVAEQGEVWTLLREVEHEALIFPNYAAFEADGTLWFTDSGVWGEHRGRLIRVAPDGSAEVVSRALNRFPNGCAITPDGRWLWVVESLGPTVSRFDVRTGEGPEVIVTLHGHVPDGLAFTADGGCLIANYRPDRIYHLNVNGHLEVVAQDPHGTLIAAPTNVCFVGEGLDHVVSANLGRWHLTWLDLGLAGSPLLYPKCWAADSLKLGRLR
jgi:sugar lactone lactonase YvrE